MLTRKTVAVVGSFAIGGGQRVGRVGEAMTRHRRCLGPVVDPNYAVEELSARAYSVRSASVGDNRAARSAGYNPASAPMASAAPNPP